MTPKVARDFPGAGGSAALDEGYEASFVVLEGDPLEDLANLGRVRMVVKVGVPSTPPGP